MLVLIFSSCITSVSVPCKALRDTQVFAKPLSILSRCGVHRNIQNLTGCSPDWSALIYLPLKGQGGSLPTSNILWLWEYESLLWPLQDYENACTVPLHVRWHFYLAIQEKLEFSSRLQHSKKQFKGGNIHGFIGCFLTSQQYLLLYRKLEYSLCLIKATACCHKYGYLHYHILFFLVSVSKPGCGADAFQNITVIFLVQCPDLA